MSIQVLSYAYGNAAGHSGCADGPEHIKNFLEKNKINLPFAYQEIINSNDSAQQRAALNTVVQLNKILAQQTYNAVKQHQLFLTLGGDNTCSIGTWSGVAAAIHGKGDLGLLWLDAHMDSHTFDTTPSNNIHGMPLASLLGHGNKELINIYDDGPKLKPENVVLMGIRSYEPEEKNLLTQHGVKVFFAEDILQNNLSNIITTAIDYVATHTAQFGLMIDLDFFDPQDAPGVGTPVKQGIHAQTFLDVLPIISHHPKFIGAEICEYNPHLDKNQQTLKLIGQLIQKLY